MWEPQNYTATTLATEGEATPFHLACKHSLQRVRTSVRILVLQCAGEAVLRSA